MNPARLAALSSRGIRSSTRVPLPGVWPLQLVAPEPLVAGHRDEGPLARERSSSPTTKGRSSARMGRTQGSGVPGAGGASVGAREARPPPRGSAISYPDTGGRNPRHARDDLQELTAPRAPLVRHLELGAHEAAPAILRPRARQLRSGHADGHPAVGPALRDQKHGRHDGARLRLLHDEPVVGGEGRMPALEQIAGPHASGGTARARLEADLVGVEGGQRARPSGLGGSPECQAVAEIANASVLALGRGRSVPLELAVEVAALDAELLGGAGDMCRSWARSSARMKARSKASRASLRRPLALDLVGAGRRSSRAERGREVLGADDVAGAHDDEPLDHVAQLAHVARPVVGEEVGERLHRDRLEPLAVLGRRTA